MKFALLIVAIVCGCSGDPGQENPAGDTGADGPGDGQAGNGQTGDALTVGDDGTGDAGGAGDEAVADSTSGDATGTGDSLSTGDTRSAGDTDDCPGCWRSALYPSDWSPGMSDGQGRSLPDFSFAGYHRGELPLPSAPGVVFDVSPYGADPTGALDSTASIQAAIDDAVAAAGGSVYLPAGEYRVDDLLTVTGSNIVVRGDGPGLTRLVFTRATAMTGVSNLTFRGAVTRGADLMLAADADKQDTEIQVTDASTLAIGDTVALGWVITDEFVADHGMTGTWQTANGQWRAMFRREVTAIDLVSTPHRVTLDIPLRYAALVRDQASLRSESGYLTECGLESLSVSNAVEDDDAWAADRAHAITLTQVRDCWIRNVSSFDSPLATGTAHLQSGGILVQASARVTVADTVLERAQNRGGGGNGYLYEIMQSGEVLIRDSVGRTGRHNFIQNWDFGTSGCVFLRCVSEGGRSLGGQWDPIGLRGDCEFHHSLAMSNLIDSCELGDGWYGGNRKQESSGAGHTTTSPVYWNLSGGGMLRSFAYGWGYVIEPGDLQVNTVSLLGNDAGSDPEDWVERAPVGATTLQPGSLYEDQLAKRLAP